MDFPSPNKEEFLKITPLNQKLLSKTHGLTNLAIHITGFPENLDAVLVKMFLRTLSNLRILMKNMAKIMKVPEKQPEKKSFIPQLKTHEMLGGKSREIEEKSRNIEEKSPEIKQKSGELKEKSREFEEKIAIKKKKSREIKESGEKSKTILDKSIKSRKKPMKFREKSKKNSQNMKKNCEISKKNGVNPRKNREKLMKDREISKETCDK